MSSIIATGPRDAWALGQPSTGGRACGADVEHWNGARWRRVLTPRGIDLSGSAGPVAASSAGDAWIFPARVGHVGGSWFAYNYALHWNGSTWRKSAFPVRLGVDSAVALGPADVWAFGPTLGTAAKAHGLDTHDNLGLGGRGGRPQPRIRNRRGDHTRYGR